MTKRQYEAALEAFCKRKRIENKELLDSDVTAEGERRDLTDMLKGK